MCGGIPTTVDLTRCDLPALTISAQRQIAKMFGSDLFTSPAFEMLLDLYVNEDRRPRSITSLTTASSASERNSQRIIYRMVQRGLLTHFRDGNDGRRIIVELAPQAVWALDGFFEYLLDGLAKLGSQRETR